MSSSDKSDAYPLRTVSRLTGLSPDLIRAWEKRYAVVAPIRGSRGARLYSRDDIDHLRSLARAVAGGRAIGDVARLDRQQVKRLAEENEPGVGNASASARVAGETIVERALNAVQAYDDATLRAELGDALAIMGPVRFVDEVATPLLTAVGERWHAGGISISQEHMASAALRNFLHSAIASRRSRTTPPSVLLATTSGEKHEGGLLMVALLLLEQRIEVAYLGPEIPGEDIVAAATELGVAVVALSFTSSRESKSALEAIRRLDRDLPPTVEVWLGGKGAADLASRAGSKRIVPFQSLDALQERAAQIRAMTRPGR